jgi:CRISPR/Cas system-associated endonuclease Cas3-HD
MDDEKLERTIQFILNNQAQFTVDVQKLQETQKEAEKRTNVLERAVLNLYNTSVETTKNIQQLTESQKQLTADISKLRESQKETDGRLNAVILMVERYLSRENGKS